MTANSDQPSFTEWEVIPFVDNRQHGSDHHTYKITPQRGPYGSMFEHEARLAAAAPDMDKALEMFLAWFEHPDDGPAIEALEGAVSAARCARSKARGES